MASIKSNMIHGVFWSAIEKYSGIFVSLIISMVLARLLTPEEYGIVAVATVLVTFVQIFSTMGIGPAIIQNKNLSEDDYNNIFTFSFYVGFILASLFGCVSPMIATYYGNEQLSSICKLFSINLLFAALNMVPNALMIKNFRFREIALRTLILQIGAGVVGIVMALNSCGVYSLVIPNLLTTIFIFFINLHFYPIKIKLRPSFSPIKKIYSYSLYQFLFSVTNYFTSNLDKLIIGKYISSSALGYYDKAYRLMQLPLQNVTSVISPVLHPVLSSLQDDLADMASKYNKIVYIIACISFPCAIIFYHTSGELVTLMYGSKWDLSILPLQILTLSLPSHMILATSGSVWQASNATKYLFWVGLFNTIVVVSGYFIAAFYFKSIVAISYAWTVTSYLNFIVTYVLMYKLILKSSILQFLSQFLYPSVNIVLLLIFYTVCGKIMNSFGLILDLAIKGGGGLLLSCCFIQYTNQFNIFGYIYDKYDKLHKK